jgi:exodeoxyribonuclease-3
MRIISFNVNGIRSMAGKVKSGEKTGTPATHCLKSLVEEQTPDVLCLQEIKTQSEGDLAFLKPHFPHIHINAATSKKGYSGVALLSTTQPEWVHHDLNPMEKLSSTYSPYDFLQEGRMITAKFPTHIVVNVYTVNSKPELARLEERLLWEQMLREYLAHLEQEFHLPVILCGDLNVAHQEIDIYNPKGKSKTAGFSNEERHAFTTLLKDCGMTDTFRHLHPDTKKYTYWSNYAASRQRNVGWRIDYVLVSNSLPHSNILDADCLNEYGGSDHCPVVATIQL